MLSNLNKYKVLLASKSPRRRELLQQLRVPFNVITIGGIDESFPESNLFWRFPNIFQPQKLMHISIKSQAMSL